MENKNEDITSKGDMKCSGHISGGYCEYVDRVICAVRHYQSLDMNKESNQQEMIKYFDQHKTFLDDYQHLISEHDQEIDDIYTIMLSKYNINSCDISICSSVIRHHDDFKQYQQNNENANDNEPDNNMIFYRNTMDSCHCYLHHIYDIGLRVKMNTTDINCDDDNCQQNFGALRTVIKQKCINMEKLGFRSNRYKNKRFAINAEHEDTTCIDGLYNYLKHCGVDKKRILRLKQEFNKEEYDSDALMDDIDALYNRFKDSNIAENQKEYDDIQRYIYDVKLSDHSFHIGYTFYYWKFYESRENCKRHQLTQTHSNQNSHLGYQIHELYVAAKYDSLKDEMLNNAIYSLNILQLNISATKAHKYINTDKAKKTQVRFSTNDPLHYDIPTDASLHYQHLLSIILYTDWSELSREFSNTFRKKEYEALSMIKSRNSEYANWAMKIRETVEYFGNCGFRDDKDAKWNTDHNKENGPFFCGMSFVMVIPEFNIRLNGPTSTTKNIEVATRFGGDDGIIMTLNNNGYANSCDVRNWNCNWLSNYTAENERLWCGGRKQLKVESVTIIEDNRNYYEYFQPLFYFDCMCSGTQMQRIFKSSNVTSEDYNILSNLIQHRLSPKSHINKYPKYIYNTFHAFTNTKKQIVIHPGYIDRYFDKLKDFIMEKTLSIGYDKKDVSLGKHNLFKPIIFKLFPNVESIVISSTAFGNGKTVEYRIDILLLLSLIEKSVCKNINIKIIAHHKYKYKRDENNRKCKQYSHIDRSWLFQCNTKSAFIQSKFKTKYKISLQETVESSDKKKRMDILEISN